jgi:hypothetical protein
VSAKRFERALHFVARMDVTGTLRDHDSAGKELFGFFDAPHARQKLAVLEIASNIFRMIFEEMLKMLGSCFVVAELHAFQREAVAREGVRWSGGDELLENFTAGLLRLGHFGGARIIAVAAHARKEWPTVCDSIRVRKLRKFAS